MLKVKYFTSQRDKMNVILLTSSHATTWNANVQRGNQASTMTR